VLFQYENFTIKIKEINRIEIKKQINKILHSLLSTENMKFHIITLGCQMNYSDSARITSVLKNCGFSPVETIDEADIIIFDTCSVRQKSEDKVT
jgi:tRNA-2-methylthio-N6-dimethylallyladenosine synthase